MNPTRISLLTLTTLLLVILAMIPAGQLRMELAIHRTLDAGHFIAFGVFALLLQHLLSYKGNRRATVISLIVSSLLIVVIELIQPYVGRTATLGDVFTGLFGMVVFLLGRVVWLKAKSHYAKYLYALITLLIFLITAQPAIQEWRIVWWRATHFPVLGEFEEAIEKRVWRTNGIVDKQRTKASLSREHVRYGKSSLKVETVSGTYSGVSNTHGGSDWSGYKQLNITIYNPGDPYTLYMRIDDDTLSPTYKQRFNSAIKLANGWNPVKIPISKIANGPRMGKMNMESIRKIIFFTQPKEMARVFYLDRMWLD